MAGKKSEAINVLEELKEQSKRRYVAAYDIAILYAGLGEKGRTIEWLKKAIEERSPYLAYLKVEPRLDPLHSDPRFQDLVRRIGLPP